MSATNPPVSLEVDDLQAPLLHPRPTLFAGKVILARIDDRHDGRELLRRLIPFVPSAAGPLRPDHEAWAAVALSFQGLRALGVPDETLASFPREFQQGMAARAELLGDTGDSAPEQWESPLGGPDVHLVIYALAPDAARLEAVLAGAHDALRNAPGVAPIWQRDTYVLPSERTSLGFKDGISHPAIEGSGIPGSNPHEQPFKAGEFILGYPNELGQLAPMPQPALLGADPGRNNAFLYAASDDARELKCPIGAHARRGYPRDSNIVGVARLHRIIRRSSSYGPMLPEGVLEDDRADRGILFFCLQANLARGFEFVKTQWINEGTFVGMPDETDPLVGPNHGTGVFTIPQQPIRRRLTDVPQFVVNRGGEYCFMPGLRALGWLAALDT